MPQLTKSSSLGSKPKLGAKLALFLRQTPSTLPSPRLNKKLPDFKASKGISPLRELHLNVAAASEGNKHLQSGRNLFST